jgi:hypothetical protein
VIPMMTRRTAVDGSEVWMELISKKLLRRAMADSKGRAAQGIGPDCSSIPKLAVAAGVSQALVGFLVSEGDSSRTTTTTASAEKIAAALGWDRDELFRLRRMEKAA